MRGVFETPSWEMSLWSDHYIGWKVCLSPNMATTDAFYDSMCGISSSFLLAFFSLRIHALQAVDIQSFWSVSEQCSLNIYRIED